MKEIKGLEIKEYLTYEEIQAICNAVCKSDEWAIREFNLDVTLLKFATNLSDEDIKKYGHEELLKSGTIDLVKDTVKNFNRINEAIEYTESTRRSLAKILKDLPSIMEPLKDVVDRGYKPSTK